jgi:uncharacterized protein
MRLPWGETLLKWIFMGGYPDLHARNIDPNRFYSNLLATYLELDIKRLSNIQNLRDFDRFLRCLALRSGQMLSMNGVAGDLGVSQGTIKNWLNLLIASNVVTLVEPWNDNPNKRLVKTPKVYFNDTGLLCSLLGFRSPDEILRSPLLGSIFETHTFCQILRCYTNSCVKMNLNYFRTHEGAEIDFVISNGINHHLIECKWSENPSVELKGFESFKKYSNGQVASFQLVCSARGKRSRSGSVTFVRDSVDFSDLVK